MVEKIRSGISYEKGTVIRDDKTLKVFLVLSCTKDDGAYTVEIADITKERETLVIIERLKTALKGVKMHDKDLFMLENIVLNLEEIL